MFLHFQMFFLVACSYIATEVRLRLAQTIASYAVYDLQQEVILNLWYVSRDSCYSTSKGTIEHCKAMQARIAGRRSAQH